jgi:hypothetical protein
VLPVMTEKTTTRKRSTSPAARKERRRVRLPMVRIGSLPFVFIWHTASTASRDTSRVFGHCSGSVKVLENTIFDMPARASVPGLASAAMPAMSRYVFASIRTVQSASVEAAEAAPGPEHRLVEHVLCVVERAEHPVAVRMELRPVRLTSCVNASSSPRRALARSSCSSSCGFVKTIL